MVQVRHGMISRHDALNHSSLPTNCHTCARHVGWRAMTKPESSTHIALNIYAVLICIDFIKGDWDDTAGYLLSIHSYTGIPALSGTGHIIFLVAFVVSSLSLPALHAHFLSIIQMVSSLVSSSPLCPVSHPSFHPWIIILVATQPVLWFYDPLSIGLSVFR
jgi:hypothetical protein